MTTTAYRRAGMARGQVWLASVPFQEDPSSSKSRPVIVLGEFPDGDVFAGFGAVSF